MSPITTANPESAFYVTALNLKTHRGHAALFVLALICVLTAVPLRAQYPRKIVADIFTNSHCGPCASMHAAVNAHITSTDRSENVIIVYHHLPIYLDDPIYRANTVEPMQRAQFLGGVSGTPTVFFSGTRWTGPFANWPTFLDSRIGEESPISIDIEAEVEDDSVITQVSITSASDLNIRLYAAVVENVTYTGRNGVSEHDGAFRRGFTTPSGMPLNVSSTTSNTLRLAVPTQDVWNQDQLRVVVIAQHAETTEQLQATEVNVVRATTSSGESLSDGIGLAEEIPNAVTSVDVYDVLGSVRFLGLTEHQYDDLRRSQREHGVFAVVHRYADGTVRTSYVLW
ncbi:MAG TPA: hypothetical protein DIS79_00315 [Bacteroidetes bacterium]|nr:hypothetical protein [Bacteroidota bacterium]HRK05178.1 hypothetical protein [Chlorobiota bacterium]